LFALGLREDIRETFSLAAIEQLALAGLFERRQALAASTA